MRDDDPERTVESEMAAVLRVRRRAYMAMLGLVIGILGCAWLLRDPSDVYRTVTAPVYCAFCLALIWLLWRARHPLARLETTMIVGLGFVPLGRQVWLFHMTAINHELWLRLLGNAYWVTSGVVVLFFAIVSRRRALLAGSILVAASMAVAAGGVTLDIRAGLLPDHVVLYVAGALIFLTAFLVIMGAATIMHDQWRTAIDRAAAYSHWAMHDGLTGLANRRAASQLLARDCAAAARYGRRLSVIIGDLDGFKYVNDTAGHAAGDAVLAGVGAVLTRTIRESDIVARWGGEEFLIIASGSDLASARALAERCRAAIAREPIAGVPITMTFGVAQYDPGDTRESMLERADERLYLGKSLDRNRVQATSAPAATTS